MSKIKVNYSSVTRLQGDFDAMVARAPKALGNVVKSSTRTGGQLARRFARGSAGSHGKHYPSAITWDRAPQRLGTVIRAEYGPDPALPQGGMSFEGGSRNQPPHNDLAKSADIAGPAMAHEAGEVVDDLFEMRVEGPIQHA